MKIRTLTPLAALILAATPEAAPQSRAYVPGTVRRIETVSGAEIDDLHALHFATRNELDAVFRVGTTAYLLRAPTRHDSVYVLATNVDALAVLEDSVDRVVAVKDNSLVAISWNDGNYATTAIGTAQSWANVVRMWAFADALGHVVHGWDQQASLLYTKRHNSGLGPSDDPDAWTDENPLYAPAVQDIAYMDLTSALADKEAMFLVSTAFVVMNHEMNQSLDNGDAVVGDQIGGISIGSTVYYLHATRYTGPSLLDSQAVGSTLPDYDLESRVFSDLLTADLDAPGGSQHEVILPETTGGHATALTASSGGFARWLPGGQQGKDTIDTYEFGYAGTRAGLRCAATGDFDNDGDVDLLVAHEGSTTLRLWANYQVDENDRSAKLDTVPSRTGENYVQVTLNVMRPEGAEDFEKFRTVVWLDKSYETLEDLSPLIAPFDVEAPPQQPIPVPFPIQFSYSTTTLEPDHVLWISITGIDENSSGVEIGRGPARIVYDSPDSDVIDFLDGLYEYYPKLDHVSEAPGGDPTGLRNGPGVPPKAGAGPPQPNN